MITAKRPQRRMLQGNQTSRISLVITTPNLNANGKLLQRVMRPRTPIPQVTPSAAGGVQLEWHEKGVDLELHVTAPYQWELWFRDLQDPISQPVSLELTDDFSELKRPIALLTTR